MVEDLAKQNWSLSEVGGILAAFDKEIAALKSKIEIEGDLTKAFPDYQQLQIERERESKKLIDFTRRIEELKIQEAKEVKESRDFLDTFLSAFSDPPQPPESRELARLRATAKEKRSKVWAIDQKLNKYKYRSQEALMRYESELKEKRIPRKAWRQLQKQMEESERKERKKITQQRIKAQADAYREDIREQSETIKRRLKKTEKCPYCDGPLGEGPHADHIYPVNRGGLSTTDNMINVCSSCNLTKGALTLRQFCEKTGFSQAKIEKHLDLLGKVY